MVFNFIKESYAKIKKALIKTTLSFKDKIQSLFSTKIDEETINKLEQVLYEADLGVKSASELTAKMRALYRKNPQLKAEEALSFLKEEMLRELSLNQKEETVAIDAGALKVILIVGVNGNGKTTTVAKLAKKESDAGKKVLVAAADTFRAGAIAQLEIWASKIGVDIVKGAPKSDPSSVVYDALSASLARKKELLLIDTAGRLHTKLDLMQELEKIKRCCKKLLPEAPHEIFLVLDASTGQNAIDQAKIFHQYTGITGIVLTKLDGTAKGGIVMAIQKELGIPVRYVGVGEGMDDLEVFNPEAFVSALFDF